MRVMWLNVLSQHVPNGDSPRMGDALGLGQGGTHREVPNLREQVQNLATHGTAGLTFNQRRSRWFRFPAVCLAVQSVLG